MPTTPVYQIPYLAYSDAPDLAALGSGIANRLEALLTTKFSPSAAIRYDGTPTTVSVPDTGKKLTAWSTLVYNTGDITYSGGIYTVHTAGIYMAGLNVHWTAATSGYRVTNDFIINNTETSIGAATMQFVNGMGAQWLSAMWPFQLGVLGTVQANLGTSSPVAVGLVDPISFSLTKVG